MLFWICVASYLDNLFTHIHTRKYNRNRDRTSQTFVIGRTHKNVQFRPPDRLTTQSEKNLDLAVRWPAFSLLSMPFWILAGTCHMVYCRWIQMIKDGQCLQIRVFSCNIRYGICKKRRSWNEKTKWKNLGKIIKNFFFQWITKLHS